MKDQRELLEIVNKLIDYIEDVPSMANQKKELETMAADIAIDIMADEHERQLNEIENSGMPKWMRNMYN